MNGASTETPTGATSAAAPGGSTSTAASADAAGTAQVRILLFLRDRGIIMLWLLLVVVFAFWAEPYFFTWTNARLVANAAALSAVFAAAVAFGILSGALDLSIPGTAALAGVVAGKMIENGVASPWAIVAGIAVGIGVGLVNGLLIQRGLNPLVVSIATLTVVGGVANLVAGGVAIRNITQLDWAGRGRPFGIPSMVLVVAALYFVAWVFLTRTRGGARLQAVGGSAEAVRRIGVNADLVSHPRVRARRHVRCARRLGNGRHHPSGLAVGIREPAVRRAHGGRVVGHAAHRWPRQLPRACSSAP